MLNLIASLWLAIVGAGSKTAARPIQTCVWPNTCAKPVMVAQYQPCVWPNRCAKNA